MSRSLVVELNSGGPRMLVVGSSLDGKRVTCVWDRDGEEEEKVFQWVCLKPWVEKI